DAGIARRRVRPLARRRFRRDGRARPARPRYPVPRHRPRPRADGARPDCSDQGISGGAVTPLSLRGAEGDAAISIGEAYPARDCFAALAMTAVDDRIAPTNSGRRAWIWV